MTAASRPRAWLGALWLVATVPALLGALAARAARDDLLRPYAAFPAPGVAVEIPSGAHGAEIGRRLEEAGVVPSALLFRAYLRAEGLEGRLRAGEYRFEGAASPAEVARKLVRGEVVLHAVTVPEGLTVEETARALAAPGWWSEEEVRRALAHPEWVRDMDPRATTLEGYLFPETYTFSRGTPAREIVRAMIARFRRVCGPPERVRAAGLGFSTRQIATLASLVEKEARLPEERPVVASVIHNRLRLGMKLEVDATVIHALRRQGRWNGSLLLDDLKVEDPYNTYLAPGLPPGPICSPGEASLRAALRPAETAYLYYVVDPDGGGGHRFSRSLAEHQQAVWRYRQDRRSQRREAAPAPAGPLPPPAAGGPGPADQD